jgi:hypothetical protein
VFRPSAPDVNSPPPSAVGYAKQFSSSMFDPIPTGIPIRPLMQM